MLGFYESEIDEDDEGEEVSYPKSKRGRVIKAKRKFKSNRKCPHCLELINYCTCEDDDLDDDEDEDDL